MKRDVRLDELDRKILKRLQEDATISYKDLAAEIGAPESTIYDRTKRLKDQKIIKAVVPLVDNEKLGILTTAFIRVSIERISEIRKIAEEIAKFEEVLEVHEISGEWDILVKIKVRNNKELRDLEVEKIGSLRGIRGLYSLICIGTIKEDIRLKI
ncbi:MAG: Lrp/AsnC family transcriptional regulator [Theionarchaea archaeon]|nr:Lrp/AsnC family transcriptional regulator [Theionarchaea archaeon]